MSSYKIPESNLLKSNPLVDINHSVVLTSGSFLGRFSVASKTRPAVIQRVDKNQRQSTSNTTAYNIFGESDRIGVVFLGLDGSLNLILESKIQSLSGEVTETIGEIASPKRQET